VVDGLIPVEGMVAVSGDPGSYKTWLMMEMALSVASGKNFLGKFPTKQGGVIIVDEENPARLLQKRFKRMSLPEEELPISILPLSGFQLTDENVPFLLHEAKRQGTKLIIFDSLVRIHSADENDAKKMAEVFSKIKRFIQANISVAFIHHNRKQTALGNSAQAMRGSSDILASVDSHLAIKYDNDTNIIVLEQTKSRFDKRLPSIEIQVEHTEEKTVFQYLGEQKGKKEVKSEKAMDIILNALNDSHEGINQAKIVELVQEEDKKIGRHNILNALKDLNEADLIQIKKGERNSNLYFLKTNKEFEEIPKDSS
jgi:RecA-family ATPase